MAMDHTLARALPPGRGVVRLYGWATPTLSFGRNEPARDRFDPDALRRDGVDVVRRPTGGRVVLHHHELTYAVAAPIRVLGGVRAAYVLVNRALSEGLARLGIRAALAAASPTPQLDAGPCFGEAAGGEVVVEGRKRVGSAQVRIGEVLLQHGSILIGDDQWRVAGYRSGASASRPPRGSADADSAAPAALSPLLGREVTPEEVADAVAAGFRDVVPGDWRGAPPEGSLEEGDLPHRPAPDLLERYRDDAWSWRR